MVAVLLGNMTFVHEGIREGKKGGREETEFLEGIGFKSCEKQIWSGSRISYSQKVKMGC